jgi:hypothetical protein
VVEPVRTYAVFDSTQALITRKVFWRARRSTFARLTVAEAALYEAPETSTYGSNVRLEQELINWSWALRGLECRSQLPGQAEKDSEGLLNGHHRL